MNAALAWIVNEVMRSAPLILTALLVWFMAIEAALAQEPADNQLEPVDSTYSSPIEGEKPVHPVMGRRSPTGALLRSAVVPGWGQFYNHKYIKSLVVASGETLLLYNLVKNWKKADEAYSNFSATDDPAVRSLYYSDYDFYQNQRDLYLWLSGVTIFLSMIDAYVDAHLAGFDVDVTPPFDEDSGSGGKLSLIIRF